MAMEDSSDTTLPITHQDVLDAQEVIGKHLHPSPLIYSPTLSRLCNAKVYLKAECLQLTGSFKARGAFNRVAQLNEVERAGGVIAASAGNHAQGVALAAREMGIAATIVMPLGTPLTKQLRTADLGAEVIIQGHSYEEAFEHATEVGKARGMTYIHAFDDPHIMAGQGTLALEVLQQCPNVDAIITPIGGGGLIAGMGAVLKHQKRDIELVGVQAEGAASAHQALAEGYPITLAKATTLADGIRIKKTGDFPFRMIKHCVKRVYPVPEDEIVEAIAWLLSDAKLVVEGAGAVGVAALRTGMIDIQDKTAVVILSGGNIDLGLLSRVVESSLTKAGRQTYLEVLVPDKPGMLGQVVSLLADANINILDVEHHRGGWKVPVGSVAIAFLLETRDHAQAKRITKELNARGWEVTSHGSSLLQQD